MLSDSFRTILRLQLSNSISTFARLHLSYPSWTVGQATAAAVWANKSKSGKIKLKTLKQCWVKIKNVTKNGKIEDCPDGTKVSSVFVKF